MDATAAVVKEKEQPFEIGGVSIGEPRPDEVLVKVVACGVCHTDLICRDEGRPRRPGRHEL
jgi:aryl-alcohol dehydrogenase